MPPDSPKPNARHRDAVTRREAITAAGFVPLTALLASAQTAGPALPPEQMRTLEAFVDRLVPSDELGPGAVEAGVMTYIDRALSGAYANRKAGLVAGLSSLDEYARKTHGGVFAGLSAAQKDAVIGAVEADAAEGFAGSRAFFTGVRSLTMEGLFGDPWYGGNRNFIGWDLIRYPGPRLAVAAEDQAMKAVAKPYRRSARGVEHGR